MSALRSATAGVPSDTEAPEKPSAARPFAATLLREMAKPPRVWMPSALRTNWLFATAVCPTASSPTTELRRTTTESRARPPA